MVLELDLSASSVGRQLLEYIESDDCEALIVSSLEDVFSKKATATLSKRAASILKFVWWARKHGVSESEARG